MEQTLVIKAPETDRRLEGKLTLKASQPGADTYVDVRDVPVMPWVASLEVGTPVVLLDRTAPFVVEALALSAAAVLVVEATEQVSSMDGASSSPDLAKP